MRDRRSVDELTIEELERILAIRKRAERQERLRRYAGQGRVVAGPPAAAATPDPPPSPRVEPRQHEAAVHLPPVEPPVAYDLTDDVPRFEDDLEAEIRQRQPAAKPTGPAQKGRKGFDRVLLAIEVVAVIGVVLVLAIGVYLVLIENDKLDALEQKSAEIQQEAAAMLATPSPAPSRCTASPTGRTPHSASASCRRPGSRPSARAGWRAGMAAAFTAARPPAASPTTCMR